MLAYILEKFPSPTEYFILNEIIAVKKQGFDITVLVLNKQKKYYGLIDLKKLNCKCVYLPEIYYYTPFLFIINNLSSWIKCKLNLKIFRSFIISKYFKRKLHNIDINHIHAHFAFIATDIAKVLANMLNVEYSFTAHANDIYTNSKNIINKIADSSFVVTCTEYNQKYLNKISNYRFSNKIYKIYHGIEIEKWNDNHYKNNKSAIIRILSVARLVEKKGLIYLLEAITILYKRGVEIECTIIGSGALRKKLQKYIDKNNIKNQVKILPFCSQDSIKQRMNKSDIFILPSIITKNGDRDGIPNVLLEAMLSGLPVISTNVSGIHELIIDRETGLLVSQKNSMAIADAVIKIKNNSELYKDIIYKGKEYIKLNFEFNIWLHRLCSLYENYLQ